MVLKIVVYIIKHIFLEIVLFKNLRPICIKFLIHTDVTYIQLSIFRVPMKNIVQGARQNNPFRILCKIRAIVRKCSDIDREETLLD